MIDYLRFRWELYREERWQRKTAAAYDKDIAAAKKRGEKHDKIYEIESLAHHEYTTFDEEITRLHTRHLMTEAHRLIIPTPAWDDKESWEENEYGPRALTRKGLNDLRAAVRAEKKVRRETILMWVPVFTAATGLAGALIGLAALLLRK
jgi:hypothetical protein